MKVITLPNIEDDNPVIEFKILDPSNSLSEGQSGALVSLPNGKPLGMLIESTNGIGLIRKIDHIDTLVETSLSSQRENGNYCIRNPIVCIAGVASAVGILGLIQINSNNDEASGTQPLNIPIP